MKNKELIITLIILLSILIVGLIIFLCFAIRGSFKWKDWGTTKSEQVIFDETYDFDKILDLEILSTAGDIKLEESTNEKVRVVAYGKNAEDLQVELQENKLKVDYSKYKYKNTIFNLDFYSNDILIYLPESYNKNISIQAKYGDIEVMDFENASIQIEEDCGDVDLGTVKNATVKNHYGDIKIEEIGNQFEIDSDCGDVTINAITIAENSSIVNNLGDIKIGKTNEIYIDAKTDLGDVKVNQNYRHSEIILKLQNDCGDIKVEN